MNRAYVQRRADRLVSPSATAADGLAKLGYEVVWFDQADVDKLDLTADTLVVGFIEVVRGALKKITGKEVPVFNYPYELLDYLGRRVWLDTLGKIRNTPEMWPVFIKPSNEIKSFGGRLVRGVMDLVGTRDLPNDTPVWASEPVEFLSEFRCFVRDGNVIGCRHYKGDPLKFPDSKTILMAAKEWVSAPAAYCLDVGVVYEPTAEENAYDAEQKKNPARDLEYVRWKPGTYKTLLVEINDAYSAGDYGLESILYARFLEARWCELTGAKPIP